jgi:hypothetical protein
MKRLRWLLAGVALTGSLICFEVQAQGWNDPRNQTAEYYGSQDDPAQYQAINYEQEAQPACDANGGYGPACDSCYDSNCDSNCMGGICDNTELFVGGDSYASLGDFPLGGFGNSFGMVGGFNSAAGLGDSQIRGQFGATYGGYDFSGRGFGAEAQSLEEQIYVTGGVSKRSDVACGDYVSWGIVYDALFTDNWGANALELTLGQYRGIVGYALNDCNEVGVWAALNAQTDGEVITGRGAVNLKAMNQGNIYWRRSYETGATTMLYFGAMDDAAVGDWVVGLNGRAPLNDRVALYGNFNYVTPGVGAGILGDQLDQWNVSFGLVFNWGCKAKSPNISGAQGLPLLPVANNGSFLITD